MKVSKILARNLKNLYVVGGALRDILMGKVPKEFDLITTSSLDEIPLKTFAPSKDGKTVGVFVNGTKYDVTHYMNLKDELQRRDFTVNSIAAPVSKDGTVLLEEIFDPFNGVEDLKRGVLRTAFKRNMFSDPVRVFRALRFIAQEGFSVEDLTLRAMVEAVKDVNRCAKERIYPPLEQFIFGTHLQKAVRIAQKLDIEKYVYLPLKNMGKVDKLKKECRWPAVFFKTGNFEKFVEVVSPPRRVIRKVKRFARLLLDLEANNFMWTIYVKNDEFVCLKALAKIFNISTEKLENYERMKLAINPYELEKRGFQGKKIRNSLQYLWEAVLNGTVENKREELLKFLKTLGKSREK